MEQYKLKSTSKFPTTLIVKGLNPLGLEIAKTLIDQGGYVVILDSIHQDFDDQIEDIEKKHMLSVLDLSSITSLDSEMRRIDYVFYFAHETKNYISELSSQEFLQQSNYLDSILDLVVKYEAKFLLTTSIKAHQLLIESHDYDFKRKIDEIPQYSETEIQRYAENLVKEYQNKMEIDARILRIGELLGKGFNPDSGAGYLKLIMSAINGKALEIEGDGLETDFYLHYIDAARGIIQAMFSVNTKGETYSLAIPEEISILSITYKIAEIEHNSGEIKFTDYKNSLPPLRLYKPATNLTAIGWENKINIDRSLAQTIDYIREKQAEETEEIKEAEQIEPVDFEDKTPEEVNAHGALARLISERKHQEKSRIGSVVLANEKLREKMREKKGKKGFFKKLSFNADWVFNNFKKQFNFLKNVSVKEFVFYCILFGVFLLFYFLIISPFLNIVGNGISIYANLTTIESDIKDYRYQSAANKLDNIKNNIDSIQKRLNDVNYIFNITKRNDYYKKLQSDLTIQKDFVSGLAISLDASSSLIDFLKNDQPEIISRISDQSSLDIKARSTNNNLIDIERDLNSLKVGIEKVKINSPKLADSFKSFPDFIDSGFKDKITNLNKDLELFYNLSDNVRYIPSILGSSTKVNYLAIIEDNTRITPAGGRYASYILFSFENGLLSSLEMNTIDKIKLDEIPLEGYQKEELNLVSTRIFNASTAKLQDSEFVSDIAIRGDIATKIFEKYSNKKINGVIFMNLATLGELIGEDEFNIQNVRFTKDNFISALGTLAGSDEDTPRDAAITTLSSTVIAEKFRSEKIFKTLSLIGGLIKSNDIAIYSASADIKGFVRNINNQANIQSDYINFGIDTNGNVLKKLPSIKIFGTVTIKSDFSTIKDITINAIGNENLSSLHMCLPSGSKDFIIPESFPQDKYSRNFSSSMACQIYLKSDAQVYPLNFSTLPFSNQDSSGYNYVLKLAKPSGIYVEYELEFKFDNINKVTAEEEPTISKLNNFVYKGTLDKDLYFKFIVDGRSNNNN